MGQNKLGVYLCNAHDRAENWDYIKKMNPKAIRVFEPSVNLLKRIYDLLPEAMIFPRYYEISENQSEYQKNPVNLAKTHANYWKNKIAEYQKVGMDKSRFVTVSTNEPRMWSDIDRNADYKAWVEDMQNVYRYNLDYNMTLGNELGKSGIKTCLWNISVGWPTNLRDGEPPYWEWSEPAVDMSNQYGHFWTVHEYWPWDGPQNNWRWLAGRWCAIPYEVKIVIGEVGIDRYVNEPNIEQHQRGWKSKINANEYAVQLNSYAAHLDLDDRVFVCFPFLTDFFDRKWQSFDTFDCRNEILREKQVNYDTYLPVIINTGGGTPIEPPKPDNEPYKLQWPPLQPLTQYFNDNHPGIDIGLGFRTPIYAIADGEVAWVDFEENGYGNYVRVYHKHLSAHSFGAHFDEIVVKQYDKVKKGQLLGYSGHTGRCEPPGANHYHFEIRLANEDGSYKTGVSKYRNAQVDPIAFLAGLDSAFGHE